MCTRKVFNISIKSVLLSFGGYRVRLQQLVHCRKPCEPVKWQLTNHTSDVSSNQVSTHVSPSTSTSSSPTTVLSSPTSSTSSISSTTAATCPLSSLISSTYSGSTSNHHLLIACVLSVMSMTSSSVIDSDLVSTTSSFSIGSDLVDTKSSGTR